MPRYTLYFISLVAGPVQGAYRLAMKSKSLSELEENRTTKKLSLLILLHSVQTNKCCICMVEHIN